MKTALVLFSGGVDSTYIVTRSVDGFDKLVLMTYRVPGMIRVERSRKSSEQLIARWPDKIEHRVLDIADFVTERRGNAVDCVRDNVRYKFFYSWCMGCKVSMHLYTMRYCNEHGIEFVLDGSNFYDAHALEQHKEVKDLLSEVYRSHGIEFVTPHYFEEGVTAERSAQLDFLRHLSLHKDSTEFRNVHLKSLGIDLGKGLGSQYRATQPSCLTSVFFNAARVPLKLVFGEEQGCCYMSHGYLNYITDKIYGREFGDGASAVPCAVERSDVYLDNASTTRMDPAVIEAVRATQEADLGNASALHDLGVKAAEVVDGARARIADAVGAAPEEICFTSGGTEANNLALQGAALARGEGTPHIVTTPIEHPSVLETAKALGQRGVEVTLLPVDGQGRVSPDHVASAIRPETRLVSVIHGNHEIGTIQPIAEIGAICRKAGVRFHTDACQSFTKVPIDVREQKLDLVSLNAHKIHGPKGVGALVVRGGVELAPLMHGGEQESGLRSGTLNTDGIAGFAKAVEIASPEDAGRMADLRDRLLARLRERVGGVRLNGPARERLCHNLSVSIDRVAGKAVLARLNALGFYISTRSACSSKVLTPSRILQAIGLSDERALQTVRVGLSKWTTREEVDLFADAVAEIVAAERARGAATSAS